MMTWKNIKRDTADSSLFEIPSGYKKIDVTIPAARNAAREGVSLPVKQKEVFMCQTCGCSPCMKCGAPIENGVCSTCKKKSSECTCKSKKT